jgi:hypothetical protein
MLAKKYLMEYTSATPAVRAELCSAKRACPETADNFLAKKSPAIDPDVAAELAIEVAIQRCHLILSVSYIDLNTTEFCLEHLDKIITAHRTLGLTDLPNLSTPSTYNPTYGSWPVVQVFKEWLHHPVLKQLETEQPKQILYLYIALNKCFPGNWGR